METILSLLSSLFISAQPIPMVPVPYIDIPKPPASFSSLTRSPVLNVLGVTDQKATASADIRPDRLVSIKIAVLGDSMVDTLGPGIPALQKELIKAYPYLNPTILNYGDGGTNIDYGIERLTTDYEYLGKHIPSLVSQQPDIIVIESFAYNPYSFDEGALNRHWLALAHAVDTVNTHLPNSKVVIATTIAPNSYTFGDGAANIAYTPSEKKKKTDIIKSYLHSTNRFAMGEKLPLADAYTASISEDGNGKSEYINSSDNIHPSEKGAELFAQILVQTLTEQELIP